MRELFKHADTNADGFVDYDEYVEMFARKGIKVDEAEIKKIFRQADRNRDWYEYGIQRRQISIDHLTILQLCLLILSAFRKLGFTCLGQNQDREKSICVFESTVPIQITYNKTLHKFNEKSCSRDSHFIALTYIVCKIHDA